MSTLISSALKRIKFHPLISTVSSAPPKDYAVKLNVGGMIFQTKQSTLSTYPTSKLANLDAHSLKGPDGEYFFDRNPKIFALILEHLRTYDHIRLPEGVTKADLNRELRFFAIDGDIELYYPPPKESAALVNAPQADKGKNQLDCMMDNYLTFSSLISSVTTKGNKLGNVVSGMKPQFMGFAHELQPKYNAIAEALKNMSSDEYFCCGGMMAQVDLSDFELTLEYGGRYNKAKYHGGTAGNVNVNFVQTLCEPQDSSASLLDAEWTHRDGYSFHLALPLQAEFDYLVDKLKLSRSCELMPLQINIFGPGATSSYMRNYVQPKIHGYVVVCLPSKHEGGDIVITHQGTEHTVDFASKSDSGVQWVSFLGDCAVEMKPVTSGTRLAVTYAIGERRRDTAHAISDVVVSGTRSMFVGKKTDKIAAFKAAIADYKENKQIGIFLAHHYSSDDLKLEKLKGSDKLLLADIDKTEWECQLTPVVYHEKQFKSSNDDEKPLFGHVYAFSPEDQKYLMNSSEKPKSTFKDVPFVIGDTAGKLISSSKNNGQGAMAESVYVHSALILTKRSSDKTEAASTTLSKTDKKKAAKICVSVS